MKKRVTATFFIENDLQEFKLVKYLDGLGGSIKITPYNETWENNKHYKELKKAKKIAEDNYYNFLNNNR